MLLVLALDHWLPAERWLLVRRGLRIAFIFLFALALLSGVPVSSWQAALLLFFWVVVLIAGFSGHDGLLAGTARAGLAVLLVWALASEGMWRSAVAGGDVAPVGSLIVLGDSLSSGDFGEGETWVDLLSGKLGIPVRNLSQPSATTGSALRYQLGSIEECHRCGVIIELGGNDMLDGVPPEEMESNLVELIREIERSGAEAIWVFELPVPAGRWAWARAQREAIRKTGVGVIPRRVLASVLANPDATLDGLHPNDRGHELLAREIARYVKEFRREQGSGGSTDAARVRESARVEIVGRGVVGSDRRIGDGVSPVDQSPLILV